MCISDSNKTLKLINTNNNEIKSNVYLPWEGLHLTPIFVSYLLLKIHSCILKLRCYSKVLVCILKGQIKCSDKLL